MKQARDHYERIAGITGEAAILEELGKLSNKDLHALHLYSLGREPGGVRDAIQICLLMECGDRFLAKQAAKQAKRGREIF